LTVTEHHPNGWCSLVHKEQGDGRQRAHERQVGRVPAAAAESHEGRDHLHAGVHGIVGPRVCVATGCERRHGGQVATTVGGFENSDSSFNLRFDYLPTDMTGTTIQMRAFDPRSDEEGQPSS
jgi:hypothetical protein